MRVYVTSYSKYNEGKQFSREGGRWYRLPLSSSDEAEIASYGEETMITDYELGGIKIGESDFDAELLNSIADLSDAEVEIVAYLQAGGYCSDLQDCVDHKDAVTVYSGMTMDQVAESMVDDGLYGEIPDSIKNYIDYAAIARDLECDGYCEEKGGVYRVDF